MTGRRAWLAFFAVGFAVGCVVSLDPDKNTFGCETDEDCGGDGYVCEAPSGLAKRCCKPSGVEVCNGLDDDCNGQIDEGFNLQIDGKNCGSCGAACGADQICEAGVCKARGETACGDGLDNDGDGKTDCADNDCNAFVCGPGCVCKGGVKSETDCTNGVDDDADGNPDCADPDCENVSCGTGCTCKGGVKAETLCNDNLDNNDDGGIDCLDPTCLAQLCKPAPSQFRCNAAKQCVCGDGGTPSAETGIKCRNGLDDDCNGLTDCADPSCGGQSCEADGGAGCQCRDGGRVETNCADRIDNDGDLMPDCAEMLPDGGGECPVGTACTYVQGNVKSGNCAWDTNTSRGICK